MPRRVRNILGAVVGALFAFAATSATADFTGSRDWFNARSEVEQRNIQGLLVLLGHYEGRIDGAFGRLTHRALVDYERSRGFDGDGVLTPVEERQLTADALAVHGQFGFGNALTVDDFTGIALPLAERIFVARLQTPNGTRWESADGRVSLETVAVPDVPFDVLYRSLQSGEVVYDTLKRDFFVVSGREGARAYYISFRKRKGGSLGFSLTWDADLQPVGSTLAAFLFSTVSYPAAFSETARADAAPVPLPEAARNAPTGLPYGAGAALQLTADAEIVIGACPELTLNMDVLARALGRVALTPADAFDSDGRHRQVHEELVHATVTEIVASGLSQEEICASYLDRYGRDATWPNPPGLVQPRTG